MIDLAPNNFSYGGQFGHRELVIKKQEITSDLEFDLLQQQILRAQKLWTLLVKRIDELQNKVDPYTASLELQKLLKDATK